MNISRISSLISAAIMLSMLFISYHSSAFAQTKFVSIHGEGFGNDGLHFRSFVDCTSQQHKLFFGGSHLNFAANLSNTTKSQNGIGTWMIKYKSGELPNLNSLVKAGTLTNGTISGSHYNLKGLETTDTVCGGSPTQVTLSGECGQNTAVNYDSANGEKTGSTVPPQGKEVFYLFGSDVHCTAG
jgi:hypothetical protein